MNTLIPMIIAMIAGITGQHSRTSESLLPHWQIAYNVAMEEVTGTDDYDIFVMNPDGSHPRNITNHPDVAWTYYAYKDRLFFISDRDTCHRCYFLYEMRADGSEVRKVSDLRLEDSWMSSRKNGSEMIVSARIINAIRHQLFIIHTDSGIYQQVTQDTAAMFRDPCFSPDGSRIVFAYREHKRDRSVPEELYVMDTGGGPMTRLTHYPEDNISLKQFGYRAGAARWHPGGEFITYLSHQDGKNGIFAVAADGSKQWKLTDHAHAVGWHDWSPDGNWLVYDHSNEEQTEFDISLMNWKTKETRQLTEGQFQYQQAPVFVLPAE